MTVGLHKIRPYDSVKRISYLNAMTVRTEILRLRNTPERSRLIGELISQQRLAYNWGVDQLNRQPGLEKRTSASKGHTDTLSSRFSRDKKRTISVGRGRKRKEITPAHWKALAYIHQDGYEKAHLANERFRLDREARLQRIKDAEDKGEEPRPRDIRPHRRTLKHRRRKNVQSLTVNSHHNLRWVCACGIVRPYKSEWCKRCGSSDLDTRKLVLKGYTDVVIETVTDLPENVRSVRFVEIGEHRPNAPLADRRYCLHVSAQFVDPPQPNVDRPDKDNYVAISRADVVGLDDGAADARKRRRTAEGQRIHWFFDTGHSYAHQERYPKRKVADEQRAIARKQQNSRRKRRAERQRLERNRIREAERRRQFNHHAIDLIKTAHPTVIAIENKSIKPMMSSAKGNVDNPGQKVRQKAGLNRTLAAAGLSGLQAILASQCQKAGVLLQPVHHQGSSRTCSQCGHRHKNNRESQAVFLCRRCKYQGDADFNAAEVLGNRLWCQIRERLDGEMPPVEDYPTGWRKQPSRLGQQRLFKLNRIPAGAHLDERVRGKPASGAGMARVGEQTQPQLLPGFT